MRKQDLHPRTAVLNQKEKNACKLSRLKALAWLATSFPEAFCNQQRIRPLKIGILHDLLQHAEKAAQSGISKSKLREALVVFTRRIDYLTCLKAREMRIDLDGNPTNAVTEEEAEKATSKIQKRVEKSARNARKNLDGKTALHYQKSSQETQQDSTAYRHNAPSPKRGYPERAPAYSAHNPQTPAPQSLDSVVIKRKITRAHDPEAVARLKAKLGLKRQAQDNSESHS